RCASYLSSFSVYTTSVESIVDNLSNCRNVRIHIHAVARGEMTNDALCRNFTCGAGQFRKSPCLNMIDSLKPLSQRQALVKIHDSLSLLINRSNYHDHLV